MRAKFAVFASVVGMLLGTGSAIAHHSFAAEFDAGRALTLKGVVRGRPWSLLRSHWAQARTTWDLLRRTAGGLHPTR